MGKIYHQNFDLKKKLLTTLNLNQCHSFTKRDESEIKLENNCVPDRGVHDANTMSPDGVCNVSDVDGVEVLIVTGPFNKYLDCAKNGQP